jgi:serine/threonine-protein kinase
VAIKVLPEEFAKDADRVARFQREAKLLASLNHPNIAAIYGLEEFGGTNFLVMELVEGATLDERIKAGPVPVEEALKLALQIAEALEAAHEKGVIHRDLKPANIKVTPDSKVKVLDFGLAKAFAGEQAEMHLSNSPTLSDAATQQGIILGTAAYMSPEQARGKSVDKRADIWAFGAVLFEMLTGRVAFQGEDVSEILASVIKGDVKLDLLPANMHPRVREVIIRCLQRDLNRRYQDIRDARYEIEQALADPKGILVPQFTAVKPRKRVQVSLPWIAAAVVLTAIIAGVSGWKVKPSETHQVMRFEYDLPEGQQFNNLEVWALAVSPDGKQFVYNTPKGLYLRSVDAFDAKLIIGTEISAINPFFSPDGKWVGYWSEADNKLKKIAISGGAPVVLCEVNRPLDVSWGAADEIVYGGNGIRRVSANGGTPEAIVKPTELSFTDPQILPDGKTVLFAIYNTAADSSQIAIQSLTSGERRELFSGDGARYVSTGHIVYGVGNNLLAVPFDLKTLAVAGGPVPVVEGVWRRALQYGGAPQYAVSDSGTLVYIPGTANALAQRTLVWVERNGKEEPIAAPPNDYCEPRISPDGTKLALEIRTGTKADIWIWDLIRETMTRLTFNEGSFNPLWTLDGKRVAFRTPSSVFWKAADGTGGDEKLSSVPSTMVFPWAWSSDGKVLVTTEYSVVGGAGAYIGSLSMESDHKSRPLLLEKYSEIHPKISPDGRWMAYMSNESGKFEIYVRPFPDVNKGKWQVSTSGGDIPLWSPNGRELFYRNGDSVLAVAVEDGQTFKCGKPEVLFRGTYVSSSSQNMHIWDISPDGKRFLMIKEPQSAPSAGGGPHKINIVLNWTEELKQRVPVK